MDLPLVRLRTGGEFWATDRTDFTDFYNPAGIAAADRSGGVFLGNGQNGLLRTFTTQLDLPLVRLRSAGFANPTELQSWSGKSDRAAANPTELGKAAGPSRITR